MSEENQTMDKETAVGEFDRWVEAMRIDMSMEDLNENDKADGETSKVGMIKALRDGRLVINEAGQAVFTPLEGRTLTWKKAKGSALTAMDRKKSTDEMGKIMASMGEITGTDAVNFVKMDYADLKICLAIYTLFLA